MRMVKGDPPSGDEGEQEGKGHMEHEIPGAIVLSCPKGESIGGED